VLKSVNKRKETNCVMVRFVAFCSFTDYLCAEISSGQPSPEDFAGSQSAFPSTASVRATRSNDYAEK
jgi:hypothetical protein